MLEGLPGPRLPRGQLDLAPEALAGERHVRPSGHREPDPGPRRPVEAQAEPGRVARGPEDPGGILDEGERPERAEPARADIALSAQRIDQVAEPIRRERHRQRVPLAPGGGHVDPPERGPVNTRARGGAPALDRRGPE